MSGRPGKGRRSPPAGFPEDGRPGEKLAFLLRYAVLAPSSHNTQPWRFALRSDAIELFADRAHALPEVDPADRELTISCGAALLNLRVALRHFGYRDDRWELLPDAREPDLLARIGLVRGSPATGDEGALFDAIARRRTTRGDYEERSIPDDVQSQLEEESAREGASLHAVAANKRDAVARLIGDGDRAQMGDERFRDELAAWLRPNRSRRLRGMRGYSLGLGDLASLATPLLVRRFDMGNRQAAKDRRLALRSPLLAVLATHGDSPREWLTAGQSLERVLLRACTRGLTASFFNQPVEVPDLRRRLADVIGTPMQPQLILRFGYAPESPPTPRESVSSLLDG